MEDEDYLINPYNFNNKEITEDFVNRILKMYGVLKEPNDITQFQLAFVHSSYQINPEIHKEGILKEKPEGALGLFEGSYERLEYLGDSILGAVVAHYLYERYPAQNEGFLSQMKVKLVRKHALAFFSKELGFAEYIILSRHMEDINMGRKSIDILEDTFEAFIGAIYLTLGYSAAEEFLINLIEEKVDFAELIMTDTDFKGQLTRYYQRMFKEKLTFEVLEKELDFVKIGIYTPDKKLIGEGHGINKKTATQDACKNVLNSMDEN